MYEFGMVMKTIFLVYIIIDERLCFVKKLISAKVMPPKHWEGGGVPALTGQRKMDFSSMSNLTV